jgi:hypothetical protein
MVPPGVALVETAGPSDGLMVVGSARVTPSRLRRAVEGHAGPTEGAYGRGRPGDVVDAGEGVVHVPLLGLAVAAVPGCSAVATLRSSTTTSGGLGFSLFGLSLAAEVTVEVDDALSITCQAGRTGLAELPLPVLWTLKSPPGNDDYGLWVELEPLADGRARDVVVRAHPPGGAPVDSRHYAIDAEAPALDSSQEYRYERNASLELMLEVTGIPLGASVTIERTSAHSLALAATLAPGHEYLVSRWAGVAGGVVTSG